MGGLHRICLASSRLLFNCPFLPCPPVSTASGDCYTFGSNQHGQLGTSSRRVSRAPCRVQGLEGIKMVMVACGDTFTVAIGAGEGGQDEGGPRQEYGGLHSTPSFWSCSCCPVFICLGYALFFHILGRGRSVFLGQRSPRSTGKGG